MPAPSYNTAGLTFDDTSLYVTIFASATSWHLDAYRLSDGSLRWSQAGANLGIADLAGAGMVVAADPPLNMSHPIAALNAASGAVLWRAPANVNGYLLCFDGGNLYIGNELDGSSNIGALSALDPATGQTHWSVPIRWIQRIYPIIYLASTHGPYALDARTGAVRWHIDIEALGGVYGPQLSTAIA